MLCYLLTIRSCLKQVIHNNYFAEAESCNTLPLNYKAEKFLVEVKVATVRPVYEHYPITTWVQRHNRHGMWHFPGDFSRSSIFKGISLFKNQLCKISLWYFAHLALLANCSFYCCVHRDLLWPTRNKFHVYVTHVQNQGWCCLNASSPIYLFSYITMEKIMNGTKVFSRSRSTELWCYPFGPLDKSSLFLIITELHCYNF